MTQSIGRAFTGLLFNMAGTFTVGPTVVLVSTSAMALPLGQVTAPSYFVAYNLDATNFIRFMNGSGGAKVVKIGPGKVCIFPWDDAATPYCQADTAACNMEYMLLSL